MNNPSKYPAVLVLTILWLPVLLFGHQQIEYIVSPTFRYPYFSNQLLLANNVNEKEVFTVNWMAYRSGAFQMDFISDGRSGEIIFNDDYLLAKDSADQKKLIMHENDQTYSGIPINRIISARDLVSNKHQILKDCEYGQILLLDSMGSIAIFHSNIVVHGLNHRLWKLLMKTLFV